MSDPLTGTGAVLGGGLLGSVLYGVFTHTDFGVVFGAFGGACSTSRQPQTCPAPDWQHIS